MDADSAARVHHAQSLMQEYSAENKRLHQENEHMRQSLEIVEGCVFIETCVMPVCLVSHDFLPFCVFLSPFVDSLHVQGAEDGNV